MNEQSVDIAFNIPEIESNSKLLLSWVQKMIDAIKDLNAMQVSLGGGSGNAGGADGAANKAKQAATEVERLTKKLQDLQRAEAEQAAQLKVLISGRNAELKTEAKLALGLVGEYDKLTAKLKEQEKAYRNLAATQGASAAQVEKLRAQTAATREQINKIGKGIGDFSKEVGNYKKGFDGLGASLQGLLREAPSVQSMDQLFLSWSNQLPQFFDEIQKVTVGINEFKAATEAATIALTEQQALQNAAQEAAKAAEDSLIAQVEGVIESIGASQEQAAAIMEQVAAHTAEIETTGAATAQTVANTEAVLVNAGATVEQVAATEAEIVATASATTISAEATVALEAQTVATAELTAQQVGNTSVLARIGKSLLSVNTLLIAGVLVLTMFGGKIIDAFTGVSKATKDAEDALKKYKETIENIEVTERKNAQQQMTRLAILTQIAKDNAQSTRTRTLAVEELQKTYPETFGALEKQAILEGRLGDAVKITTEALINRSLAHAAEKKLTEASDAAYTISLAREEAALKYEKAKSRFDALSSNSLANPSNERTQRAATKAAQDLQKSLRAFEDLDKQMAEAQAEQNKYLRDAQAYSSKSGTLLFTDNTPDKAKGGKTADQLEKDRLSALKRASEEQARIILDQLNNVAENENSIRDKSEADLLKSLQDGNITVAQYQKQKEVIVTQTEDRILKLQIDALNDYLTAQGLLPSEIATIQEKITELINAESAKRRAANEAQVLADKKSAEDAAKNLMGFQDAMYADKKAKDEQAAKDRIDLERKLGQELIKIGRQTEALINSIVSASIERQISELEKKQEVADEAYNKDKANIEASTQSEKDKADQIAVLDAQNEANKEEIARKIAEQRRKQAAFDKAAALLEIGITTGVNIVKAFPNPVLMAAAGVLGALQAATVISAKIPEYAEGKDINEGYTGAMIWGEAGSELKIDRHGKVEVAHEATVGHTQRGDRIFSNEELKSLANGQTESVSQADYALLIKANAALLEQQKKSDNKNTDRVIDAVYSAAQMTKTNYLKNAARA